MRKKTKGAGSKAVVFNTLQFRDIPLGELPALRLRLLSPTTSWHCGTLLVGEHAIETWESQLVE